MAAAPLSFPAERLWTEEKEKTLICFFSNHSCLWNHRSESYKNRRLRWRTLERLRALLSAQPPAALFTVDDIKNKFKNLRTTFQRQFKMVRASKACGSDHVFAPQWKHYQQLMFLQGSWDQEDAVDDQLPASPPIVPQGETQAGPSSPGLIVSFLPNLPSSLPSPSSSGVPSNGTVKCFWTEERERALVTFYSEHSCLWNKQSENHNNRQLRLQLLETLRAQLSDPSVSFSVEDIKSKFKNLRTVFNRELKAVHASRASDRHYVSKWKHYQQLLFLRESWDEDDGTDNPQEQGNHTSSSTLSGFSSSSANSIRLVNPSAQGNARNSAGYQILLSPSPDDLKLSNQTAALPNSPADRKPCTRSSAVSLHGSVAVGSDARAGADSRCQWSEAKVQQLISFYSEHSCLWNHRSESYRNRLRRQSLLDTLSGVLSDNEPAPFTVEDIKTKFRNLRTIFQREHKAVSANRTCGSEDFYLPKWKYYSNLMFLCDSCDEEEEEEERPEDLPFHPPQESSPLHLDSLATPPLLRYHTDSQTSAKRGFKAPPSPTPPDSQHSSPCSSPHPSTSSSHSRVSGRKRAPPTPGYMLDFMRTFCRTESPHAGFLKYVEECLNETPPDRVKKLKKKIIETIHSASDDVELYP